MAEGDAQLFTLLVLLTALCLALVVLVQLATTYTTAYLAAPREVTTFLDVVDFPVVFLDEAAQCNEVRHLHALADAHRPLRSSR